jgi:hypothetical protein
MSGARLTTNRWPAAPPDMDAALKLNTLNNATAFFKVSSCLVIIIISIKKRVAL